MQSNNVIITGTSRGIGYEMVKLFATQGWKVLALSRNEKPIKALQLTNVTALRCDISKQSDLNEVKYFIINSWQSKVKILIHNAGALINTPFSETTIEAFKAVYEVNVFGVVGLTQTVVPFMDKNGHVVSISSMGGVQGSAKFSGLSAYSSSKGAIITLTELLAEEYKEIGPAFNVLALGAVQTAMLEEAFPGYKAGTTAQEMAEYIVQFAIKGQRFYNGKLLQISNSTP